MVTDPRFPYSGATTSRRAMLAGSTAALLSFHPLVAATAMRSARSRLALTTVSLRDRIPFRGALKTASALRLEDAPTYIRAQFGLNQVELWSPHFAADSDAYCASLGARFRAENANVCNIQLDGRYDLSHPDRSTRADSEAFALQWIRRALIVGSSAIRINTGASDHADPALLVPIYRRLANYGQQLGVRILVENHIGASRDIAWLAKLVATIDHPNLFTLADWGNSPEPNLAARLADLSLLYPKLALVSAKGLHFDTTSRHVGYPIAPLVAACEASGYRGLYSIELFTEHNPPEPISAIHAMIAAITQALSTHQRKWS